MTDRWAMSTRAITVAGVQEVAAVLDFSIERRVIIGLDEIERVQAALDLLGMADVQAALNFAAMNKDNTKYISIPWTDAPNGNFDAEGIAKMLEGAAHKVIWRIEGAPADFLSVVVSCAGSETRFELRRAEIDGIVKKAAFASKECEDSMQRTNDAGKKAAYRVAADIFGCIGGFAGAVAADGVIPGAAAAGVIGCYTAFDDATRAANDAAKYAAEEALERERNQCGYAGAGGDGSMAGSRLGVDYRVHAGL